MTDHVEEIRTRLADPFTVAAVLGLTDGLRRRGRNVSVRCPAHAERNASCSLTVGADGGLRCRCFSCGWSGDVLTLVAEVHGLSIRADFRGVLERAADLAGVALDSSSRPMRRREIDPAVDLAVRVDAAAHAWLSGRDIKPDNVIESASAAALVQALADLVELDEQRNAQQDARDAELERLALEYESGSRNLWRCAL